MAEDKSGELEAFATGGPSAAAAYRAEKSGLSGTKSQALQDAANRSGAAYAPTEFRNSQSASVGGTLDPSIAALGAQQGAAGQYQGALQSAQGAYTSGMQRNQGLLGPELQRQAQDYEREAMGQVTSYLEHQQAQQEKLLAAQEKQKKAIDDRNKDYADSAKRQAVQDATVDADLSTDDLDALDSLLKYDSYAEAEAVMNRFRTTEPTTYVDSTGKPVAVPVGTAVDGEGVPISEKVGDYLLKAFGTAGPNDPMGSGGAAFVGDDAKSFKELYGR